MITTRLFLLVFVFALSFSGIALLVWMGNNHHIHEHEQEDQFQLQLIQDAYLLRDLTRSYQNQPTAHHAAQWKEVHQRVLTGHIHRIVASGVLEDQMEQELLDGLIEIANIFEELEQMVRPDNSNRDHPDPYQNRLFNNIGDHLSKLLLGVEAYWKGNQKRMMDDLNFRTRMMMVLMVGLIILVLLYSILTSRKIKRLLTEVSVRLSSASSQVHAASDAHQQLLIEQLEASTEVGSTMDQVNTSAKETQEYAEQAYTSTEGVLRASANSREQIEAMQKAMQMLQEKMSAIAGQIQQLSEHSGQIQGVTETMADIAAETNMLALNAAVEASRAGEYGKGFSVVSQEVRKLANQSKMEAQRIHTLIEEVQHVTSSTVMAADEGGQALLSTSERVHQSGDAFLSMSDGVESIVDGIQMISFNARQQASAFKQVSQAMRMIHGGAEQANAGVAQTQQAIDDVIHVADELARMV